MYDQDRLNSLQPELPQQPPPSYGGAQFLTAASPPESLPPLQPQSSADYQYNSPVDQAPSSYAPIGQTAHFGRKKVGIILAVLLAAVALAVVASFLLMRGPSPDKVFDGFLANTLKTRQVVQKTTMGDNVMTIIYDVSNVQDPKVSTNGVIEFVDSKVSAQGYGTLQDSYLKFSSLGADEPGASKVANKWVQLRKSGDLVSDDAIFFLYIFGADPRRLALGDVIFGNFSAADRASLSQALVNKKVYNYDSAKVVKDKLDNHEVYVYTVTSKKEAIRDLNKKAAKLMGIPDADLENVLSNLNTEPATAKLFIRIDTEQLVRVELDQNGEKVVNVYSDYNSAKLPAEPKPDINYVDFARSWNTF